MSAVDLRDVYALTCRLTPAASELAVLMIGGDGVVVVVVLLLAGDVVVAVGELDEQQLVFSIDK